MEWKWGEVSHLSYCSAAGKLTLYVFLIRNVIWRCELFILQKIYARLYSSSFWNNTFHKVNLIRFLFPYLPWKVPHCYISILQQMIYIFPVETNMMNINISSTLFVWKNIVTPQELHTSLKFNFSIPPPKNTRQHKPEQLKEKRNKTISPYFVTSPWHSQSFRTLKNEKHDSVSLVSIGDISIKAENVTFFSRGI